MRPPDCPQMEDHRPRGVMRPVSRIRTQGQLELGARAVRMRRATEVELYDGRTASGVIVPGPETRLDGAASWPRTDAGGLLYKTFMWPGAVASYDDWNRRAGRTGNAPSAADPDTVRSDCMPLRVIGGRCGPDGLSAGVAAARSGAPRRAGRRNGPVRRQPERQYWSQSRSLSPALECADGGAAGPD